jgi:hypothetical protein
MIRLLRVLGVMMIGVGAIIIMTYLIEPLRAIWLWSQDLPMPIQISLGVAVGGFLLIFSTLIWERIEGREADRSLLDDSLLTPDNTNKKESD